MCMKNKCDLSIIIPVYNGAEHIGQCLNSVLLQRNVDNFQIIVVNDGSTDNTMSIVQKYSLQYPNITLINQKNAGVSAARNAGIQQSKGDYITFIDADDQVGLRYKEYCKYFIGTSKDNYIDNLLITKSDLPIQFKEHIYSDCFFTNMLNAAKNAQAEVAMGGKITLNYVEQYIKRHIYEQQKTFGTSAKDKSIVLQQADYRENANFCLYSAKLIKENNLNFTKDMQLDEDILFCMLACLYASTVVTVPDVTYLYNRHENSLSNIQNQDISNDRYTYANIQRFSKLLLELSKFPQYKEIYTRWFHAFLNECYKLPFSKYAEYFPPKHCKECTESICDSTCMFHDVILRKFSENLNIR